MVSQTTQKIVLGRHHNGFAVCQKETKEICSKIDTCVGKFNFAKTAGNLEEIISRHVSHYIKKKFRTLKVFIVSTVIDAKSNLMII